MLSSLLWRSGVTQGADDPAETYHEASKLEPSVLTRQMAGIHRLERDPEMRRSVLGAGKLFPHRPWRPLPPPAFPAIPFGSVLRSRRSSKAFGPEPLPFQVLSSILFAAYGVTRPAVNAGRPDRRAVPSAGALYPLDVYVAVQRVQSLPRGLYHYAPGPHILAELRRADLRGELMAGMIEPSLAGAPAILIIAAAFWRSRVKYGLRGYRFTLLEAGHLAQNIQLAAVPFEASALPVGGFFDRRIDDLLGIDGVHESTVYLVALGPRSEGDHV
jgi:SagB-type dehydrogenase family enzyme